MQNNLSEAIDPPPDLTPDVSSLLWNPDSQTALRMTVWLAVGGLLAIYVRFLYRRFSASSSDTDSITRVFPLLLMVTTAVIAVVQSSLALSLGLVGALSIVRFRAAIKDPEELVYLFLCIAIGLALGAEKIFLALGLVVVATVFVMALHATGKKVRHQRLLLTIRGDASRFHDGESGVTGLISTVFDAWTLHRLDLENGRGQIRITIPPLTPEATAAAIARLSKELPDCEFSYTNMNSVI